MKLFETIFLILLSLSCWLAWGAARLKDYLYNLFGPGTKQYSKHTNVLKFICVLTLVFIFYSIIFHLIK